MEKESETKTGGRIGIVDVRTVEIVRVRRPLKIQIGIPVYIGRYPRRLTARTRYVRDSASCRARQAEVCIQVERQMQEVIPCMRHGTG